MQDRIEKLEDLSSVLKAKIERLTVENAGLRAHNESLLDAESDSTHPDQVSTFHHLLPTHTSTLAGATCQWQARITDTAYLSGALAQSSA